MSSDRHADGLEDSSQGGSIVIPFEPKDPNVALRSAIEQSWLWFRLQYEAWQPRKGRNYPRFRGHPEAWPRSEIACAQPIVLPPSRLTITEPIYLPSHIPLLGAGLGRCFDGSILEFSGEGRLIVLGDLNTDFGMVRSHGRTIAGIYFVASGTKGCVELRGSLSNFRLVNCHFNLGTSEKENDAIRHDVESRSSPFGEVFQEQSHLKECMFCENQIEGGRRGMNLRRPQRCRVSGNTFLYQEVGIIATSSDQLRVADNEFHGVGGAMGYGMVVHGDNAFLRGNNFCGVRYPIHHEIRPGGKQDALGDQLGVMDGGVDSGIYSSGDHRTFKLPLTCGGLNAGHSLLGGGSGL